MLLALRAMRTHGAGMEPRRLPLSNTVNKFGIEAVVSGLRMKAMLGEFYNTVRKNGPKVAGLGVLCHFRIHFAYL